MLKYAVILLLVSVLTGAVGLSNISGLARRISFALFALFFLGFLALLGAAYLLGEAFNAGAHAALLGALLAA